MQLRRTGGIPVSCSSAPSDPNPGDFVYTMPMTLDNTKEDLLVSLMQCTFTYHVNNITAKDKNNVIVFLEPGKVPELPRDWSEIIIPDGMYSLEQLNAYVSQTLIAGGYGRDNIETGQEESPITFSANAALGRVAITLRNGFQLSLLNTNGKTLHSFLGFEPGILIADAAVPANNMIDPGDTMFVGTLLPDVNRGRMAYNLHCDIIAGNGFSSGTSDMDVLATIVPNVAINEAVVYYNVSPLQVPVSSSHRMVREIHFKITDQYNRPIEITGDPTVVVLAFSRVQNDTFHG